MFSKSTNFQIYGGNFYDVGGDINLHTPYTEYSRDAGLHRHLTIHEPQEAIIQSPAGSTLRADSDKRAAGYECEWVGVSRNPRRCMAARRAPYDTSRSPRSGIFSETESRGPLSLDSSSSTPSSVGPQCILANGTFITAKNVIAPSPRRRRNADSTHAVALEALYDSADSFPQPRCHPETRMTMLEDIYKWAVQDNSSLPIRWLHGPAGAGKSAIMQSLCQRLQNARRLGGAFFFKRHHRTRGNAKVLFATLAYQLALSSRHLKPLISQSVEDDPSVVARHMDVQLRRLIVEPCQSLTNNSPPILLVDGLDECQDEGAQREILQLIRKAHIRDILGEPSFSRILHSINVQQSFEDVRTYFRDEFARIRREHRDTMGSVPIPWPSREVLNSLVEKSSGYFVYASTVIKFIDDKYFRPTERLAAVQNLTATDSDAPFGALDQMYIQILSGVPVASRSKLSDVLHCVVLNLNLQTLHIERLLELQPGDIRLLLRGLHSVLEIHPTGDIFSSGLLTPTIHALPISLFSQVPFNFPIPGSLGGSRGTFLSNALALFRLRRDLLSQEYMNPYIGGNF
ncbi:hypothetical protein B0H13DRAFT_2424247 [Mycena leptocephala]|nr:hypothetical protein B0H13DRAFT_2424247 [Mycena leptocephala]